MDSSKDGKNQIIFIRGGEVFDTKEQYYSYLKKRAYNPFENHTSWRDWIEEALSQKYEMMAPVMPNKQYADYTAWKIWFEKLFPYLNEKKLVVIGQSLGGLFLTKYLSENRMPKRIDQLHLASPVFSSEGLIDETVGDFILDPKKLNAVAEQCEKIYIYHSHDDPLVPFSHSKKYVAFVPKAKLLAFDGRGHFFQPTFPEILENIDKMEVSKLATE